MTRDAIIPPSHSVASSFLSCEKDFETILKKLFAIFLIGLGIWQTIEVIKQIKKNKRRKINKIKNSTK